MATVTPNHVRPGFRAADLRIWEMCALGGAAFVFSVMTYFLATDFSIRRIFWPQPDEGAFTQPIGTVTLTLNTTLKQRHGRSEFVPLAQQDAVYPLDTLMAGADSALKVSLNDGTIVEIGENSMIRLDFDTSLKLSGINRETVINVVSGTVAAKGGERSKTLIRSEKKTFAASPQKTIEVSKKGETVAAVENRPVDLVAKTKETARVRLEEAKKTFAKLGGVMTPNAVVPQPALPALPKVSGAGSSLAVTDSRKEQQTVRASSPKVEKMMSLPKGEPSRARTESAKASRIEPQDNYSLKASKALSFPITFKWKAEPENAAFRVRITKAGVPEQILRITADDGTAELKHVFTQPGDYTWKIEDSGGATLSVRNLHLNSSFQAIELADPVLIGREKGSKLWSAQDGWGFLFKWKPVKGVTGYKVRITRNIKSDAPVLSETEVRENSFVLPFKKEWQAERMFFSVQARHAKGFDLASNHVPFIFTFLPPKPRSPLDKKELDRGRLIEGAVNITWDVSSDMNEFTLEIAKDPTFKQKLETEKVGESEYRFYPPGPGRYYWHVRGDKDTLSSPFSETWQFTVK